MTAALFGPDLFFVAIFGLIGLVIPVWAIVDAVQRPTAAFSAAGSSKAMWIALIAVFWLLTWIIGVILAGFYLASIRPRVKAITG